MYISNATLNLMPWASGRQCSSRLAAGRTWSRAESLTLQPVKLTVVLDTVKTNSTTPLKYTIHTCTGFRAASHTTNSQTL